MASCPSDGCAAGTCVPDLTEAGCVLTALKNACTALSWSPAVSDCSAPAQDTGCCVLASLQEPLCVGSNGAPGIMALTEAGCQTICAAIGRVAAELHVGTCGT